MYLAKGLFRIFLGQDQVMSVSPDSREMDKSKRYIKTLSMEEAGTPDSAQEILGYLGWDSWAVGNSSLGGKHDRLGFHSCGTQHACSLETEASFPSLWGPTLTAVLIPSVDPEL